MSVKEVVTSLVDDGLVDTEKIGTSVYFWAFPRLVTVARWCRANVPSKQGGAGQEEQARGEPGGEREGGRALGCTTLR